MKKKRIILLCVLSLFIVIIFIFSVHLFMRQTIKQSLDFWESSQNGELIVTTEITATTFASRERYMVSLNQDNKIFEFDFESESWLTKEIDSKIKKELIKDIFKGISPTRGILFVTKDQTVGKNENGYKVYYYNIGKSNMKVKLIMEEELLDENVVSEITIEFIKKEDN